MTIYWFSYFFFFFFALIYEVFIIRFQIFFFFFKLLPLYQRSPSCQSQVSGPRPAAPHSPPNVSVNNPRHLEQHHVTALPLLPLSFWKRAPQRFAFHPLNKRADRRCVHMYAQPYKESPSYRRRGRKFAGYIWVKIKSTNIYSTDKPKGTIRDSCEINQIISRLSLSDSRPRGLKCI